MGKSSYAARLSLEAKADQGVGRSEMMKSLDKLIRFIGFALIPIGAALFYNELMVQGNAFSEAVPAVVAALIGMIPEGLYLLTSVALAVSMIRLAQKKTLAQDMNCIETLARVDVLCVDKTGTITQPGMTVRELVPLDEEAYSIEAVEEALAAPVEEGQEIGRMTVTAGGQTLKVIPLVADRGVARLTYWQIFSGA